MPHPQLYPECLNCGASAVRIGPSYCSNKCQMEFAYKQYIRRWQAGEIDGSMGGAGGISAHIRRYLRERSGNKCEQCAWHQINSFSGKIPLTIDHIDGDWMNNSPENLRYLCPNCHSLTEFYGIRNRGRGRPRGRKIGDVAQRECITLAV